MSHSSSDTNYEYEDGQIEDWMKQSDDDITLNNIMTSALNQKSATNIDNTMDKLEEIKSPSIDDSPSNQKNLVTVDNCPINKSSNHQEQNNGKQFVYLSTITNKLVCYEH